MKKLLSVALLCLLLTGCIFDIGNEQPTEKNKEQEVKTYSWPDVGILEYSRGTIVSIDDYNDGTNIKINDTTYKDFNDYVEALKTTNFSFYDGRGTGSNEYLGLNNVLKTAYWIASDGSNYIEISFVDSESESYTKYNISLSVWNSKPSNWK